MKKPLFALVLLFVSVSAIAASGDEKKSLDLAVSFVKARYSEMCNFAKYDLTQAASEKDKELVKLNENLTCSCLPTEFDNAMQSYRDANAVISNDLLLSIAKKTGALCTARQIRSSAKRLCDLDKKAASELSDSSAYCLCFEKGIQDLSDTQLADDSLIAYRNYQEKVRALKDVRDVPPGVETNSDNVAKACKQIVK